MRIARLCSELHIPPRSGGLFDQPAHEVVLLEKVYEARDLHEKRQQELDEHKAKVKASWKR